MACNFWIPFPFLLHSGDRMSLNPNLNDASVTDPSQSISSVIENDNKNTVRHAPHKYYSFAAAAWLVTLATPLLLFPRILSLIFGSLLTVEGTGDEANGAAAMIRQLNVLERTLAGLTGLSCVALAAIIVVQTGAIPMTSSLASSSNNQPHDASLYRAPTILISMLFFAALAWFSYDPLRMWTVTVPSAALTVWGCWAVLFANESIVNKEGSRAGKGAVSSFPFKNEHAEDRKKQ